MAWELWKEVLLPGRQCDRWGNWYTIRPGDVAAASRNVAKMLSNGVPIPGVWEHVDFEAADADDDEKKARYARHTFGHIAGRRVNARGALELLHRGEDERDRDQLLKTRFVSPKVYPGYSDQKGRTYRGMTIGHVAATPTPVQYWQRPFEMSHGRAIYFSYTPEGRAVADENDDKPADDAPETTAAADGCDPAWLKKLVEALRDRGMNVPDEVSDIPGLIIAIKASGDDGLDAGDDDDADQAVADAPGAGGAAGSPTLMSDARAAAYAKLEKRELERRVGRLFASGRVTRPVRDNLIREVRAVSLSFTPAGELAEHKLLYRLDAFESLPKNAAWKPTGESRDLSDGRGVEAVEPPADLQGQGGGDRAKEARADMERHAAKYSARK